jgi:hypothetical protein
VHYQKAPHAEVKLVRCTRGAVFDAAVDLRPASPTFRQWFGIELDDESGRMLYIPEGCGHGYLTLAPNTDLVYQASVPYAGQRHRRAPRRSDFRHSLARQDQRHLRTGPELARAGMMSREVRLKALAQDALRTPVPTSGVNGGGAGGSYCRSEARRLMGVDFSGASQT